jgi:type IV pilus assembly protein PilC
VSKIILEEVMAYKYRAYTLDKRIVQGTIDVTSESMAEEALYRAGYQQVLSLREARPGLSLEKLIPTLFGIKTQDVIDFSHQLATLIESGIPILTALQLLEGQASRAAFRKVIAGLAEELREGGSLSQALGKYPQAFPHNHCQVIKASEQAGNLEVGLRQVADYMEKRAATTQRVRRALVYPALVLLMAIGVVALLITVALPPLVTLFTSLGAELPGTTKSLIAIAGFLVDYKLYLLGGLLTLIILAVGYMRLPAGKLTMDRLMLKMPIIGSINVERNTCHFCQTTSMLLKAGLRLPQIMDIVIQTIGNRIVRQALRDVRDKLVQGQGLSQPMAETALFPGLLVEMVVVGEKTGTIDSTLATLADFYERRVNQRIDTLVSMIEPVLTVVIGLVITFIALSMITPLYSILRTM